MDSTMQGALLRNRNRRRTRQILQSLVLWSEGLAVSAGDYVSSDNATTAWIAQNSGVTGATAPSIANGLRVSDGSITWVNAPVQSLLKFLYSGAPTP